MFRESESLALYYNIGIQLKKKKIIFLVFMSEMLSWHTVCCLFEN